jgi:hypothetical protein
MRFWRSQASGQPDGPVALIIEPLFFMLCAQPGKMYGFSGLSMHSPIMACQQNEAYQQREMTLSTNFSIPMATSFMPGPSM